MGQIIGQLRVVAWWRSVSGDDHAAGAFALTRASLGGVFRLRRGLPLTEGLQACRDFPNLLWTCYHEVTLDSAVEALWLVLRAILPRGKFRHARGQSLRERVAQRRERGEAGLQEYKHWEEATKEKLVWRRPTDLDGEYRALKGSDSCQRQGRRKPQQPTRASRADRTADSARSWTLTAKPGCSPAADRRADRISTRRRVPPRRIATSKRHDGWSSAWPRRGRASSV